jgi:hypothetical protein
LAKDSVKVPPDEGAMIKTGIIESRFYSMSIFINSACISSSIPGASIS